MSLSRDAWNSLAAHRLQFAFTITYHYLVTELTMGLACLIFILKTARTSWEMLQQNKRRASAFAIFAPELLDGRRDRLYPMEFQFGTNWARFSAMSGGIVGQTLAMEGMFAFFLESSFLYFLLLRSSASSSRLHWLTSLLLFVGT